MPVVFLAVLHQQITALVTARYLPTTDPANSDLSTNSVSYECYGRSWTHLRIQRCTRYLTSLDVWLSTLRVQFSGEGGTPILDSNSASSLPITGSVSRCFSTFLTAEMTVE